MSWTHWMACGSGFAGLAVILGAFGAHALKSRLSTEMLAVFETGVRYQMFHALALLAVGLLMTRVETLLLKLTGVAFVVGMFLFSGSLYVLVLTGQKGFGIVTPVGGAILILGWLLLTVALINV